MSKKKLLKRFLQRVKGVPRTIRNHWQGLYDSNKKKMKRGASHINKTISWARGDNWRRKEEKKSPKNKKK